MSKIRIIVTGLIAQYPLGGITWHYLQYFLGLSQLGHDVYYFEDTGQWPFNPVEGGVSKTCDFNVNYLNDVFSHFGFEHKWAYRFPWQSRWYGLSEQARKEVIKTADLLINVSGTLEKPEKYRSVGKLCYIDTDPVFTQVKLAKGHSNLSAMVDAHDIQFSFGGLKSEFVPDTGHTWVHTRQPVVLDQWDGSSSSRNAFTTVMNWTSYKPLEFEGRTYGQKDIEFEKYMGLPESLPGVELELAVNAGKGRRTPRHMLTHKGWNLVHPDDVCATFGDYRSYIQQSRAEWSIAKHGYVVGRSGWFSDRSACYLASGKPVVVQDTGFSRVLPVGEGIVPFSNLQEAIEAVANVNENYTRHCAAASEIARQHFNSEIVLSTLVEKCFSR